MWAIFTSWLVIGSCCEYANAEHIWKENWEDLSRTGQWPLERTGQAIAYSQSEGALYVFGGVFSESSSESSSSLYYIEMPLASRSYYYNRPDEQVTGRDTLQGCHDLWRYSFKTNEWQEMPSTGVRARWGHSMAYSEFDRALFVFGGRDMHGNSASNLTRYSLETREWMDITPRWRQLPPPPGRAWYAMAYSEGNRALFVFGGCVKSFSFISSCSCQTRQALWKYCVKQDLWEELHAHGRSPHIMCEYEMAYSESEEALFLYGFDQAYQMLVFWRYSMQTSMWEKMTSFSKEGMKLAAYVDSDRAFFVSSGNSEQDSCQYLWRYSVKKNLWHEVYCASGRVDSQSTNPNAFAILDSLRGVVYSEIDDSLYAFCGDCASNHQAGLWRLNSVVHKATEAVEKLSEHLSDHVSNLTHKWRSQSPTTSEREEPPQPQVSYAALMPTTTSERGEPPQPQVSYAPLMQERVILVNDRYSPKEVELLFLTTAGALGLAAVCGGVALCGIARRRRRSTGGLEQLLIHDAALNPPTMQQQEMESIIVRSMEPAVANAI